MNIYKHIIVVLLLLFGFVQAHAETLDTFLRDYQNLSPNQKVERLEKAIETSTEQDIPVFRLLLSDAKYEVAKCKIASQMLSLAESRVAKLPLGDSNTFSRKAGMYDALAILQSIPLIWLTDIERERALTLSVQIENELSLGQLSTIEKPPSHPQGNSKTSIDDVILMINKLLKESQQENLSIIANATPNSFIHKALEKCETARDDLMAISPDQTDSSRAKWEAAMLQLGKAISILKKRQSLKYTLWAEGRYRESDPTKVSRKLNENESITLYKRLSEVNVSLIVEPSLAREITRRMYELYDNINSQKSKQLVRYEAIVNLGRRKSLDDF